MRVTGAWPLLLVAFLTACAAVWRVNSPPNVSGMWDIGPYIATILTAAAAINVFGYQQRRIAALEGALNRTIEEDQ